MNKARVFQHKFTGVQMFIYHSSDLNQAKRELSLVVKDGDNWVYLGEKTAQDA